MIDFRSLGLFRALLGAILLVDFVARFFDLEAHYAFSGILPKRLVSLSEGAWSIHLLNGAPWFQGGLLALSALLALLFLVGYRTKWVTPLLFLLVVSLHNRNSLVLNGGDHLLRLLRLYFLLQCWLSSLFFSFYFYQLYFSSSNRLRSSSLSNGAALI